MFKLLIMFILISTSAYATEPFSLRFPAALDRYPNSADTAAFAGASIASARGASSNPAAIGWNRFSGHAVTPTYSFLTFENGTDLKVMATTYTHGMGNNGNLQLSYTRVLSNEEQMRTNMFYKYDMNYFKTQLGYHVLDNLTLGFNLNFSKSETSNKDYLKSNSDTYGGSIGMLYEFPNEVFSGLVFDYSKSPSTTNVYKYNLHLTDTTNKVSIKTGIAYKAVHTDIQYCIFSNEAHKKLESWRVLVGINYPVVDYLIIKGGFAFDTYTDSKSYATGLRLYLNKKTNLDIGYQYNMYPEVYQEFGRASMYIISLGVLL